MTQEFRKTQPSSHEIKSLKLIEPGHFLLDNGVPVYTLDTGSEELIKLDLIFDAGSSYQSQPLLANMTNKCLQEGTTTYSSRKIANTVDYHGAFLRNMATKDDARLSLYCLNKHFDKLLPLVNEVAFKATFPKDEVKTIIEKSKQEYQVNLEKVKFLARMNYNGLIYGQKHPYATPLSMADYDKLKPEMLSGFHQDFYTRRPFKILLSGRLPKDLNQKINSIFGQETLVANNTNFVIPDPESSTQHQHFIEKEGSLQSAIKIGKLLFNKHHPDFIKMQVVNTILGGYFGSRLMSNIREDKGYTYGIGSSVISMQHGGMFSISSEVGTDVRPQAVEEIFKEIEKLRTELVPDQELSLVKNYLLGTFLRSADGPFALSELVKNVLDYGYDMDYYNRLIETVKSISTKEIKDLAVKYLDPASMITLVAGK